MTQACPARISRASRLDPIETRTFMAHHASAKKRIRQTEKRTEINKANVSRIRTFVKKVETAIEAGDGSAAKAAYAAATPILHRGVAKGYLHKNTAARKLSRLSARIKTLSV